MMSEFLSRKTATFCDLESMKFTERIRIGYGSTTSKAKTAER